MVELLMGQETEYAIMAVSKTGSSVSNETASQSLLGLARSSLPYLPTCQPEGMFLQNSSLLYVDAGDHVELALPEVTNPWDVARYQLAGENILSRLLARLPDVDDLIGEIRLFKTNVDYAPGSSSSWGCHESYLHRRPARRFHDQLLPHLISRLVYTGAGGWDSLSTGLVFMISPRVAHLHRSKSQNSMHSRAIVDTKDESHCKSGWHRLHLICGESVCADTSAVLKLGTTALVVALLDAGIDPLRGVAVVRPRSSMMQFSLDPECGRQARLNNGERLTALQIQRCYLNAVEDNYSRPFMPSWTDRICRLWRNTLDRLEHLGMDGLAGTLDWAIKLALFKSRAARRGIPWEQIPAWNSVVAAINAELLKADQGTGPLTAEVILGTRSPIPRLVESLKPRMHRDGIAWAQLRSFIDLRQELFEMDLRFGELGNGRLFALLDRYGTLEHRMDGVDQIERAETDPPTGGRAAVRGRAIKKLAGKEGAACYWSMVTRNFGHEALDLSDPFCDEEQWAKASDLAVGNDERADHIDLHRRVREQQTLARAMPRPTASVEADGLPVSLVI